MEWTVGELSRRSGTSISAIHFYERKGLIASRRTTGNQRRYEKHVLRRISIIRTWLIGSYEPCSSGDPPPLAAVISSRTLRESKAVRSSDANDPIQR